VPLASATGSSCKDLVVIMARFLQFENSTLALCVMAVIGGIYASSFLPLWVFQSIPYQYIHWINEWLKEIDFSFFFPLAVIMMACGLTLVLPCFIGLLFIDGRASFSVVREIHTVCMKSWLCGVVAFLLGNMLRFVIETLMFNEYVRLFPYMYIYLFITNVFLWNFPTLRAFFVTPFIQRFPFWIYVALWIRINDVFGFYVGHFWRYGDHCPAYELISQTDECPFEEPHSPLDIDWELSDTEYVLSYGQRVPKFVGWVSNELPKKVKIPRSRRKRRMFARTQCKCSLNIDLKIQTFDDMISGVESLLKNLEDTRKRAAESLERLGFRLDDPFIRYLEALVITSYKLRRARDWKDALSTVALFCQTQSSTSLLSKFVSIFSCCQNIFVNDIVRHYSFRESEMRAQAGVFETGVGTVRKIFDDFDHYKKTELFDKLYKFSLYVISTKIFENANLPFGEFEFHKLYKLAKKEGYSTKGFDFYACCLETVLFVCERGIQFSKTGDSEDFFHSSEAYKSYVAEAQKLIDLSKYLTNLEPHGVKRPEYFERLRVAIERGQALKRRVDDGSVEAKILKRLVLELEAVKSLELTKSAASKNRPAPSAWMVFGETSIGKSSFMNCMYHHFGRMFGHRVDDEYKYSRNFSNSYWDNFVSSMWCLILDDIGFISPKLGTMDPSLLEVIQIVNNIPYVPVQADLTDKGRTPVLAELVIGSSNTKHLNAQCYFSCPSAVQRRFPYVITLLLKKEFEDPVSKTLRSDVVVPEGRYPNFWNIRIDRVVPAKMGADGMAAKDLATFAPLDLKVNGFSVFSAALHPYHFENINDFLKWYGQMNILHRRSQRSVARVEASLSEIRVCPMCGSVEGCDCVVPNPCEHCGSINECDCPMAAQAGEEMPSQIEDPLLRAAIIDAETEKAMLKLKLLVREDPPMGFRRIWYRFLDLCLKLWVWCYYHIPLCRYTINWMLPDWLITFLVFRSGCRVEVLRRLAAKAGERVWKVLTNNPYVVMTVTLCGALLAARKIAQAYGNSKEKEDDSDRVTPMPAENVIALRKTLDEYYDENGKFREGMTIQGNVISREEVLAIGKVPEVMNDERENVWKKEEFTLSTFDTTPETRSWKAMSDQEVIDRLRKNCVHFSVIENGIRKWPVHAVAISGHIYMTNNHALPDMDDPARRLKVVVNGDVEGVSPNAEFAVDESIILRYPEYDLAFVDLQGMDARKSIVKLFVKPKVSLSASVAIIGVNHDGTQMLESAIKMRPEHIRLLKADCSDYLRGPSGAEYFFPVWKGVASKSTKAGDCGALYLSKQKNVGPIILGIHCAGANLDVACHNVTCDFLEDVLKHFRKNHIQPAPPMLAEDVQFPKEVVELHEKSPVRWVVQGCMDVYGSLKPFLRSDLKSHVVKSHIHNYLLEKGYKNEHGPPIMKGWKPKNIALVAMAAQAQGIPPKMRKLVREGLLKDLLKNISKEDFNQLHPYSLEVAINGKTNLAFVDHVRFSTSAGFPARKPKKHFIEPMVSPPSDQPESMMIDDYIMGHVKAVLQRYKKGMRFSTIFTGNLKDEVVKESKIESGKTRLFAGAPFGWTLVNRMFYLSISRLFYRKGILFEFAPGINSSSLQWHGLFKFITFFGMGRMIAGDFADFDKSMFAEILADAFWILIQIAKASGNFSDEDILIMECIAEDTTFPLMDFFGDLFGLHGVNPSGHPLTVIINSLVNSLYMRYCYLRLNPDHECESFQNYVHLVTYGDDNIMGVSKKCFWFNHTSVQGALAEIGIVYTMAEKGAASEAYIHISRCTFLKRSFRHEPELNCYVAPLSLTSIKKMLMWYVESKEISSEEQTVACIGTAISEIFFHGRDAFDSLSELLKGAIEAQGLEPWVERSTFPTWGELIQRFKDHSQDSPLFAEVAWD